MFTNFKSKAIVLNTLNQDALKRCKVINQMGRLKKKMNLIKLYMENWIFQSMRYIKSIYAIFTNVRLHLETIIATL